MPINYTVTPTTGTYAPTGNSITLTLTPSSGGYSLAVTSGTFTLTGQTVVLAVKMPAAVGTFTLTGVAARFNIKRVADVGTFTLTGRAVVLAVKMPAEVGTFTLTGINTKFNLKRVADTASFTLTGIAATLRLGKTIAASLGTFTSTGVAATLTVGYTRTVVCPFIKFNAFIEAVMEQKHNLQSDQLRVALTNTAPNSTAAVLADIAQITYTNLSTRNVTVTSSSQVAGTYKLVLDSLSLYATGPVAPFRYVVLYNATAVAGDLIGYYDYTRSVTLANGQIFFISFAGGSGVLLSN